MNFTNNFVDESEENEAEFPFRYVNTSKQLHVYILVESENFIMGIGMNKYFFCGLCKAVKLLH